MVVANGKFGVVEAAGVKFVGYPASPDVTARWKCPQFKDGWVSQFDQGIWINLLKIELNPIEPSHKYLF